MKWFRKKKSIQPRQPGVIATLSSSLFQKAAILWARGMQRSTANVSARGWKIILAGFCLVWGTLSVYHAASALSSGRAKTIPVARIKPIRSLQDSRISEQIKLSFSAVETQKLQRVSDYMDSLLKVPGGKPVYDSILRSHPGLMDSMQTLRSRYEELKLK